MKTQSILSIVIMISVVSAKYHIKHDLGSSYLHRTFTTVNEDIFPRDLRIAVSLSRIAGTLYYSIDRNSNQLIISLKEDTEPMLILEANKQVEKIPLAKLCQCTACRFEVLEFRINILQEIVISCNAGTAAKVEIKHMYKKTVNKDYPLSYSVEDSKTHGSNAAQLYLVNTPKYKYAKSNPEQFFGCIFNVSYDGSPLEFTEISRNIERGCVKLCTDNLCNGGICHERFGHRPICDCQSTGSSGQYCNDTKGFRWTLTCLHNLCYLRIWHIANVFRWPLSYLSNVFRWPLSYLSYVFRWPLSYLSMPRLLRDQLKHLSKWFQLRKMMRNMKMKDVIPFAFIGSWIVGIYIYCKYFTKSRMQPDVIARERQMSIRRNVIGENPSNQKLHGKSSLKAVKLGGNNQIEYKSGQMSIRRNVIEENPSNRILLGKCSLKAIKLGQNNQIEYNSETVQERNQNNGGNLRSHEILEDSHTWEKAYFSESLYIRCRVDENHLLLHGSLGEGSFSTVSVATLKTGIIGTEVAVKILKQEVSRKNAVEEASILQDLYHTHIVRFIGICIARSCRRFYIVMELLSEHNLSSFLRSELGQQVSPKEIIEMMLQIADGMAYLESKNCIHRDLRAMNILLTDERQLKISDFGLAKILTEEYLVDPEVTFPILWMSPEALKVHRFSVKSDVWSFGIVMCEILSYGLYPIIVMEKIKSGYEYHFHAIEFVECNQKLRDIMTSCLNISAESRPSFSMLRESFENYDI